MSNLNDFVDPHVHTLLSATTVKFSGTNETWYVESDQTLTLNSNTKILRLIDAGMLAGNNLNVTLNGNSTSTSDSTIAYGTYNTSGLFSLSFGDLAGSKPNYYPHRDLKVNGGETFKWSYAYLDGRNRTGTAYLTIEQWSY